MVQIFLIGVGAGAAAALLFASVASGSPLAVVLFYLAPLPILIAALGWSHYAALVAALAAAASLAAVFNSTLFIAFLIGIGLPAWWLGYLALLARPVANAPGGIGATRFSASQPRSRSIATCVASRPPTSRCCSWARAARARALL